MSVSSVSFSCDRSSFFASSYDERVSVLKKLAHFCFVRVAYAHVLVHVLAQIYNYTFVYIYIYIYILVEKFKKYA